MNSFALPQSITITSTSIDFYHFNRKIAEYKYNDVPFKPYIKQLYTPSGLQILEDAPPDHLHHHGIMFAIAVNNVNFWEEKEKSGTQKHIEFSKIDISSSNETVTSTIPIFLETLEWKTPSGDLLLIEKRNVKSGYLPEYEANFIYWETNLINPSEQNDVQLSGNHYFGLGMRLLKTPLEKVEIFSDQEQELENVRGDEYLRTANWCCLVVKNELGPFTILFTDTPKSTLYPARWFTMRTPFVYISATRNLWIEPFELKPTKSLSFSHCIFVWDGVKTKQDIEKIVENLKLELIK